MTKKKDVFYGATDTGRLRDNNEDAFVAFYSSDQKHVIAAVIDGVGGYEGGEIAAAIAQEVLSNYFQTISPDVTNQMKEAIYLANERIYTERVNNNKYDQMACVLTMAVADIANNSFHYAHVGDTRLYLFRDHSLVKVTKDHSFVGFLEDSKRISETEAMHHPKRNEINKALGFEPNIKTVDSYIETGVSPFLPGDTLLLCSDGLSDLIDKRSMTGILEKNVALSTKVKNLIDAANEAGGKDNITAVLVANNNVAQEQEAMKPVLRRIEEQFPENIVLKPEPFSPTKNERPKRSYGWIVGIAIVVLLAITFVFFWNRNKKYQDLLTSNEHTLARNATEIRLNDSIKRHAIVNLSDTNFGHTIIISDTVHLDKDSFFLKGNGVVLKADSLFKGPAIYITASNKLTEISNVTFENFGTAIQSANKNVSFKNVRFKNCPVPFQYFNTISNSFVLNGIVSDSIAKKDTIPQRTSGIHE